MTDRLSLALLFTSPEAPTKAHILQRICEHALVLNGDWTTLADVVQVVEASLGVRFQSSTPLQEALNDAPPARVERGSDGTVPLYRATEALRESVARVEAAAADNDRVFAEYVAGMVRGAMPDVTEEETGKLTTAVNRTLVGIIDARGVEIANGMLQSFHRFSPVDWSDDADVDAVIREAFPDTSDVPEFRRERFKDAILRCLESIPPDCMPYIVGRFRAVFYAQVLRLDPPLHGLIPRACYISLAASRFITVVSLQHRDRPALPKLPVC